MSKKVVTTVILPLHASLNQEQANVARRAINKILVGDENVNKYQGKKLVGKYDNHPNYPLVEKAHHRLPSTTIFRAKFNVLIDGSLEFVEMI